mgnify:CR=1 FL=1
MKARTPTVSKLIARTRKMAGLDSFLRENESMLSMNKVTGVSLNFPIADTCIPTKVCISRSTIVIHYLYFEIIGRKQTRITTLRRKCFILSR